MTERLAVESGQNQRAAVYDTPGVLCRFQRRRMVVDRCGLCRVVISDEHPHLIELSSRDIICSCQACELISREDPEMGCLRIPDRILYLTNFQLSNALWESLLIPNGIAFFVYHSARKKVIALYPGPAGAVEALLTPASWKELVTDNPVLRGMEADTEALLVNRVGPIREYYLVSINQCYWLGETVRQNWRGLSGGKEVWDAVRNFFVSLRETARRVGNTGNA